MPTSSSKPDPWFRDLLALGPFSGVLPLLAIGLITLLGPLPGCSRSGSKGASEVIVYCAQDQVYAEPILAAFTKETGIAARAVYDSEAVKTVGLANRLLAERARPQCDLFWGNEELRTRQLAAAGVWRETNGWWSFGHRSRRLVFNTNRVSIAKLPQSLLELTNAAWRGKVALAYPMFGTTATHFLALRQLWGEAGWLAWCRALHANTPFLVDGNSVVVKMVARGEAVIGFTDSDDILAEQREGLPVSAAPMNGETLLIPNTVAVVRGAPHLREAEILAEYLRRPAVAEKLVQAGALEGAAKDAAGMATLQPDWEALVASIDVATKAISGIFLR
jgi:iron(III) transport system substrate-binding protein